MREMAAAEVAEGACGVDQAGFCQPDQACVDYFARIVMKDRPRSLPLLAVNRRDAFETLIRELIIERQFWRCELVIVSDPQLCLLHVETVTKLVGACGYLVGRVNG